MCKRLQDLFRSNEGQAMSEYGLVLAIVAIALIGAIGIFRGQIATMFANLGASIGKQTTAPPP